MTLDHIVKLTGRDCKLNYGRESLSQILNPGDKISPFQVSQTVDCWRLSGERHIYCSLTWPCISHEECRKCWPEEVADHRGSETGDPSEGHTRHQDAHGFEKPLVEFNPHGYTDNAPHG